MSSIQGVRPPVAPAPAPTPAPKAQTQVIKAEPRETTRDERAEVIRGTQETGETQPKGSKPAVGSRLNVTA